MSQARNARSARSVLAVLAVLAASVVLSRGTADAAPTPVGLGTATDFAVRGGSGVSNVPVSSISGDVGLSPAGGASYAGLTCAEVTGTTYSTDGAGPAPCVVGDPGVMTSVANDARSAFDHTSALPGATPVVPDLAGSTLVAGIYSFGGAATNLSGTLSLNAQGDADSVWIFQASSSLITSSASTVQFTNLPNGTTAAELACNVYWTVGSSATFASGSTFIGTVLASADISAVTGATITGRLLAGNAAGGAGAVTLQMNTINRPTGCDTLPPGTGGGPATTLPPATTTPPGGTSIPPGGTIPPGGFPPDDTPPVTGSPPFTA
jgi:type VI secretion system secreted protein VgrG